MAMFRNAGARTTIARCATGLIQGYWSAVNFPAKAFGEQFGASLVQVTSRAHVRRCSTVGRMRSLGVLDPE